MDEKAEVRFLSKVDLSGDCWVWTGTKNKVGYGYFKLGGVQLYAHRVAWNHWHDEDCEGAIW
jgi:hypothetical protein